MVFKSPKHCFPKCVTRPQILRVVNRSKFERVVLLIHMNNYKQKSDQHFVKFTFVVPM